MYNNKHSITHINMSGLPLQEVLMSDNCTIKAKILNPNDTSKPLLLTCHGAPGLVTHRLSIAEYGDFTDLFRVLVSDLRGCGESDKTGNYTHARWIDDLEQLRNWAGGNNEKVMFAGSSHGGFLALEYGLAYPERCMGLIVGDAAAQMSHWGLLDAFRHAMTDPRSKDKVDPDQLVRILTGRCRDLGDYMSAFGTIAGLYSKPPHVTQEAETDLDALLPQVTSIVFETTQAAMGECLSRFDVRDRLKEIGVPVFVFCGRLDWICPVQLSKELAGGIKGSKLVIYEKSGHLPDLEEKSKFQKDVREWLKSEGVLK